MVKPVTQAYELGQANASVGGGVRKFCALVEQGDLDVFDHGVLWQKVVLLEDESEVATADVAKLIIFHSGDILASEKVLAVGGSIKAA